MRADVDTARAGQARRRGGDPRPRLRRGEPETAGRIEPLVRTVRGYNPKADLKEIERAYGSRPRPTRARSASRARPTSTTRSRSPRSSPTSASTRRRSRPRCCTTPSRTPTSRSPTSRSEFGAEVAAHRRRRHQARPVRVRPAEQQQAENVRKMLVAMAEDIRVLLIKLADRLHNMRTLAALPPEKQQRIATRDARDLRAAGAPPRHAGDEVGARGPRRSRRCTPKRYREIASLVETRARRARRRTSTQVHRPRSRGPARRSSASRPRSTGRPKHLYSHLREDGDRRGKEFDEIYDLVGIRVIVDSVQDCYAALGVDPRAVAPGPGPVQGLHRDAQVQPLPVAAHDGDRAAAASRSRSRSAPSEMHRRRRVRRRRALALQGGRQAGARRRRARLAQPDHRLAEGHHRPRASSWRA